MKAKVLLLLSTFAAISTLRADPVLIHEYTFGGSTVTDSVGTANGSLEGGATVSGGALHLNGDGQYVQFGDFLIPTGGADFTIRFDAQTPFGTSGYTEIISQGSGPGYYIGYDPNHYIRLGDYFISSGVAYPTDGLFHSFLLASDDAGTRFYIDNVLAASSSAEAQVNGNPTMTRLGAQYNGHGEYWNGSIDNVRIYSGAFSAEDVRNLNNTSNPVPDASQTLGLLGFAVGALALARRFVCL